MNRIAEYVIATETDLSDLEKSVNTLIAKGFQPLGPLSATYIPNEERLRAFQAMVKYAAPLQAQGGEPTMVVPE